MVSAYQPGRGYEVLGRYLSGDWFRFTEEGLVLSCGFLIEVKLPVNDDDDHAASPTEDETYLFMKWGLRYLFQTFGKRYVGDHEVDLWDLEIYDLQESDYSGDDDAATSAASVVKTHKFLPKAIKEEAMTRRQLKKKNHKEPSTSSHSLLVFVEALVSDYEIGVALKSSLDILFHVSLADGDLFSSSNPSSLLTILRFTYAQQLQYSAQGSQSFFFALESEELTIQSADTFSGYEMDLLPLSSRPSPQEADRYYSQNITWATLEQLLNATATASDSSQTSSSSSSGAWYDHLLILSSELDSGDILILIFLPIGILLGVIFLFQSYQSVLDQVLGEMGYEIHYASQEFEDSESGIRRQSRQEQQTEREGSKPAEIEMR
jgi:hypothetical protein